MNLNDISILNLMPPNLAADKNIKMMAQAFDEVLRDIIGKIPDVEMIPNLILNKIVNETLIDLLAWQFHVDFYEPGLPIEIKRELVLKSLDWHYRKGTPSVVEEIVSTVFAKAKIQEWYEYGGHPYRFRIATEEQMPDVEAVKKLRRAIDSVKNTRSCLDNLTYLTDFIDRVITKDHVKLAIHAELEDMFSPALEYNGAIDYDGETINDTVWVDSEYDGASEYDGQLEYDGTREIARNYGINTDFTYSAKVLDTTDLVLKHNTNETVNMSDSFAIGIRYEHEYDGTCDYDGSVGYDSMELKALEG
jgi:phage tail P2-like protein